MFFISSSSFPSDRPRGTPVITMEAIDPDLDATLRYALIEPRQGWDASDQVIPTSSLYRVSIFNSSIKS